jgi:RHS repeat-associated protein
VHPDHLNRPVWMTDSTEALVWDAVYWPFGAVYSITGGAVNNLRFPGQYFLLEAGLHYNWYRHYDPTLGRYTQPDPLGFVDGPSLYAYARSAPAMRIDPRGLWAGYVGGTINFQFGFVVFQVTGGFVVDQYGNIGSYNAAGGGLGTGVGERATGGISFGFSPNANTICDLSGAFNNLSLGGGPGPYVGVDYSTGLNASNQAISVIGVTIGVGVGEGASNTVTTTTITPWR